MSLKKDNEKAFKDLCDGLLGAFMSPESILEMVKYAGISKINAMSNAELGLFIKQVKSANERPAVAAPVNGDATLAPPQQPKTRTRRTKAELEAAKAAVPYVDPVTDEVKPTLGGETMPQGPVINKF